MVVAAIPCCCTDRKMTNRRLPYPVLFLSVIAFIVVRWALGGPIFRGEFVIEDFILLLTLAFGLIPDRFKPGQFGHLGDLRGNPKPER
jgi:hypothetical protein